MPAGVPRKSPRITEEDIQKVMKLHLQGVTTEAIKVRLGHSQNTIREIVNVRRMELGLPPATPLKGLSWQPPQVDLTKSRYTTKAMAKGASV